MTAMFCRPVLGAAILLLGGAMSAIAATPTTSAAIVAPTSQVAVQLAAIGDPPTVPRRRGGRQSKEKDKPYQPLAKDPVGESDAAHKEYLKRYGF